MDLKPCPLCNNKAEFSIVEGDTDNAIYGGEYATCTNCGLSTRLFFPLMDEVKSLISDDWNTRIESDRITKERDLLREELIYIEKCCTGAVQIDGAFDDTEALLCIALYIERLLI